MSNFLRRKTQVYQTLSRIKCFDQSYKVFWKLQDVDSIPAGRQHTHFWDWLEKCQHSEEWQIKIIGLAKKIN